MVLAKEHVGTTLSQRFLHVFIIDVLGKGYYIIHGVYLIILA